MIIKRKRFTSKGLTTSLLFATTLALGACSSSNDDNEGDTDISGNVDVANAGVYAFAATSAFPTGQIERISFENEFAVDGKYPATESDIRVETDGRSVYQLGRFGLDSLTKFDPVDTTIVEFQRSLNNDEVSSNPYDVVFVNDTKAYVIRQGSPSILIIDPSASEEANFITGTIDISAYDPDLTDEVPEPRASSGVIVDGKLFVLIDRLTTALFLPVEQGYVAVFDIETDTELDTGKGGADNLMGIPLGARNPTDIRYNDVTDEIYVTGRGNIYTEFNSLTTDPYTGGLFAIDAATYNLSQLLDDGDEATNNGLGFIESTLVISDEKGYVTLYATQAPEDGSSRNSLHTFNPSTGVVGDPVAALAGKQVTTMTIGIDGYLWVGIRDVSAPGFTRLDTSSDTIVGAFIQTDFAPLNIVFIDTMAP